MTLRVYNTLTKQKDLFEPVRPGKVGMYLCGPTVYKPPHIGHMVGPVIFDAVKRYLKFKGFDVTLVVNITDVEDKLINEAAEQKITVKDLAERQTANYMEVLSMMGIETIDRFPKASEHIEDIIGLCKTLVGSGHAYAVGGNVWFDVTKDPDYGKLSHRRVEEQEAGTRDLEGSGKRNPADFALWKAAKNGEVSWDSPWGKGRPGWHIECSAMSMKYLGATFDIHGGGDDLKFPHHENELAQSECATGQPFAKYWMHNGLTKIKTKLSGAERSEKMSKSLGNVIDAKQLLREQGPEVVRYMLLSTHYRRPIEFSDEVLSNTKKALSVFYRLFERVERLAGKPLSADVPADQKPAPDMDAAAAALFETDHAAFAKNVLALKMKFLEMMDDDFNTAGAIAVLHELAGEINGFIERTGAERSKDATATGASVSAAHSIRNLGNILGLFTRPPTPDAAQGELPEQLMALIIRLRKEARETKNFALADSIRDGLTEIFIALEDGPEGTRWRRE